MTAATLECDHCGDVAVESDAEGLFCEGDADCCLSCGMPGHVSIDDCLDEPIAYWVVDDLGDEARCNRNDCSDCAEVNERIEYRYRLTLAAWAE